MREMSNEKVRFCNFMSISMMMQALPVCLALKQIKFVKEIESLVESFSNVWPVGHVLVDKLVRRISLQNSQSIGSQIGDEATPNKSLLSMNFTGLPPESKSFDDMDLMRRSSIFKSQPSLQQSSIWFDIPFSMNSFSNPMGFSISSVQGLSMNLANAPTFQPIYASAQGEVVKPAKAPMLGALKPRLAPSFESEGSLQAELRETNSATEVTEFFAKGGSLGEAAKQAGTTEGGGADSTDPVKILTPIIVKDSERQISKASVSSPLEELAEIVSNSPYISQGYAKVEFKPQMSTSLGLMPIHAPAVPLIERGDRAEYIYSFPFSNDMYFSPEPLPSPLGTPIGIPHRVLFKA
jgi:hypothetical protein